MPSPINGYHQGETVIPESETNDMMGRENITPNSARPTFVRQRSNVQKVEDDDEIDQIDSNKKLLNRQKSLDTGAKSVHFATRPEHVDLKNGACGSCDGIDYRSPETPSPDEERALTDDKLSKRERHDKKKRKRKQWTVVGLCGFFLFILAAGALGFAIYSHLQKHPTNDHGVLFCYPCDHVKPEDIVTYKKEYNMCCVGKDAEISKKPGVQVSPITAEETGIGKEEHKIQYQEFEIDFQRSDKDRLGLKMPLRRNEDAFYHQAENDNRGIVIKEDGLYMFTLSLTSNTFGTAATRADSYHMMLACLRFQKGSFPDEECRKLTLLPKSGSPFEIHKTKEIEQGTVVTVSVSDMNLLEHKPSLNKMSVIQLSKS